MKEKTTQKKVLKLVVNKVKDTLEGLCSESNKSCDGSLEDFDRAFD